MRALRPAGAEAEPPSPAGRSEQRGVADPESAERQGAGRREREDEEVPVRAGVEAEPRSAAGRREREDGQVPVPASRAKKRRALEPAGARAFARAGAGVPAFRAELRSAAGRSGQRDEAVFAWAAPVERPEAAPGRAVARAEAGERVVLQAEARRVG